MASRRAFANALIGVMAVTTSGPAIAATGGGGGPAPEPPPGCEVRPRGESGFETLHANVQTRLIYDAAAWFTNVAGTELLPVRRQWLAEFENMSGTGVTSPSVTFDSGRDASEFFRANGPSDLAAFPYTCGAAALAHGEQLEAFGVVEREPAVHVELGYDSSRNVEPILLPAGGGTQTITVTITPRGERFRDWSWISIFIDAGSEDEVRSLSGPANLDEGETLIPMDRGWTLVEGVLGKTYAFEAVVFYANDPANPVRHWPGVQIYAFEQQQACDACASPGRVEVPVAALDGSDPGSGMVTVAVDEPVNILASTKSAYVTVYDRLRQEFGDCWNDVPGSGRNIVELPGDAPTDGVINPANGHLYRVIDAEWAEAEAQAQALGGHLVTLNDAAEEEWVRDTFGRYEYFGIGFNDMANEGTFEWTSGEPATYTNWCQWEPNDANEGEDIAIINWCCAPPPPPCPDPLVVTNTNDSGPCSLRAAIEVANGNPGPDTIVFNIPTTDPGFNGQWFTIKPVSPLPPLTDAGTSIDGRTQTAFVSDTNPAGPEIEVSGALVAKGGGLSLWSDGNRLHGLVVNGFSTGIDISGSGNSITGSYVGVDAGGSIAVGNRLEGIRVFRGTGNVIGGSSPAERNVISGNNGQGIHLASSNNAVRGNFIGTDRTGTLAVGNGLEGVFIWACPRPECGGPAQGNVVGGPLPGDRNVISGNNNNGVWVQDSGNVVQGNFIGTDVAGTLPLGNRSDGIRIVSDPGGCDKGGCFPPTNADGNSVTGNVISANVNGIHIARFTTTGPTSDGNLIEGNYIGTDVTGSRMVPNGDRGVLVRNGTNNAIRANVVSGNGAEGIWLQGGSDSVVQGNLVGTDALGTAALPNGHSPTAASANPDGVRVNALRSTIGGTTPAARNLISGNVRFGLFIGLGGSQSVVQGNFIGTDITGTVALPNGAGPDGGAGIYFKVPCPECLPGDIVIGGTEAGAGNLISGNGGPGIWLAGTRNRIEGNLIGTDASGERPLGNADDGIALGQAAGPDRSVVAANTIAYNRGNGAAFFGPASGAVQISRNAIFENGLLGIELGPLPGPTPNDPGDVDTGPNGLQNFPVLYMAQPAGQNVLVRGFIDSPDPRTITVELFGNDAADPSGYGEGQRFTATVTPNPSGCFTALIHAGAAGRFVTATATDAAGNTSELSAALPVRAGRPALPPRCGP